MPYSTVSDPNCRCQHNYSNDTFAQVFQICRIPHSLCQIHQVIVYYLWKVPTSMGNLTLFKNHHYFTTIITVRKRQGDVFTCVCYSVHRGRGCVADTPLWADIPLPSACWDTPPCPVHAGIHPPWRPLQRTVRILLECILVLKLYLVPVFQ